MTTAWAAPRLNIGRVISRTFGAIGGNLVSFFLLAVILVVIPSALIDIGVGALTANAMFDDPNVYAASTSLFRLADSILSLIPTYMLIGAITHGAIVHYNGGHASFGECFATALRMLLPLIGLGLLTIIGLFLWALPIMIPFLGAANLMLAGYINPIITLILVILSAIPVVLAAIRWTVAAPVLVVEKKGVIGSFSRSGDLTRDNRWAIFFLGVIVAVISAALAFGILFLEAGTLTVLERAAGVGLNFYLFYAAGLFIGLLISIFLAVGQTALYYELRTINEGTTSDDLAKVFD